MSFVVINVVDSHTSYSRYTGDTDPEGRLFIDFA